MSKDEFLKIQTCVLRVNIHCDGCKHKVKKILQKIEGVYTIKIDSEQSKVTVSGNVDSSTLIKKLLKNGKHAETLGAQKSNSNNQNHLNNNQFKNLQIDNGKGGNNNNKGGASKGGGGGINNNISQQKGGNNNNNNKQGKGVQNPQFQQMKGFEDMKMGQSMKDMKMPMAGKDQNAKSVKFKLPEDDDMSDDDFDDDFDDDDEDDFDDDDLDNGPPHKMKLGIGNGPGGMGLPNMMHNMMNGQNPQVAKGGGGNAKKGGGSGNFPVQMNHGGGGGGGSKKGGNGSNNNNNNNHNNKIQGGSMGGKNSGGGNNGKGQNSGGGNNNGQGKNGGGGNFMENGGKKVGGMNDGPHGLPSMMGMGGGGAHMGNMPMGNLTAVQGLPASSAVGGGGGYFQGGSGGPGVRPYHHHHHHQQQQQQQLAAMMMNQQRANGNERFQPMMYARPAAAVSYMPPYSPYYGGYPYPYSPPGERVDQYSMFSDENTNGCAVM